MMLGYARVSTEEQSFNLQLDALSQAGIAKRWIFTDRLSGATLPERRPGWRRVLELASPGDVIVIWKIDRLARNLATLLDVLADLERREIKIMSMNDPIDTRSASGTFVMQIFGALAQFERGQMKERQAAGIAAARARGTHMGRPAAASRRQVQAARKLWDQGEGLRFIAGALGLSRSTAYAVVHRQHPYSFELGSGAAGEITDTEAV